MKKFFYLGLVLIFFAGCSSSSETTENVKYNSLDVEAYELYNGNEFRMQYPTGWILKEKEEVIRDYKSNAEIAIVSDVSDAFFTPNILVEKVALPDGVTTVTDTYKGLEKENKKVLLLHSEVDRSEFTTFVNGVAENGLIVQFKGKRKLETDVITYLQAILVDEEAGFAYVATVAFDELDSNVSADRLVEALKTFAIK